MTDLKLTAQVRYQCSVCSLKLKTKHGLARHEFCHTGEKPYVCSTCGARFAVREYLSNHMKGHSGERKHTCQICGKSFTRKTTLNAHLATHTVEKTICCLHCDKTFTTKVNHDYHQRAHCDRQTHTCSTSNKQFSSAAFLKTHMNAHLGIKQFQCDECGKSFSNKTIYTEHLHRHRGEKRFHCEICPQRYYSQRQLKSHLAFHKKKTEFKCPSCQMFFQSDRSLQNHTSKLHANKLSCDFCGDQFVNKRHLKSHVYKLHRDVVSKREKLPKSMRASFKKELCDLCGKIMSNRYRLREHLRIKHFLSKSEIEERKVHGKLKVAHEKKMEIEMKHNMCDNQKQDVNSLRHGGMVECCGAEETVVYKDLEASEPPAVIHTAAVRYVDAADIGAALEELTETVHDGVGPGVVSSRPSVGAVSANVNTYLEQKERFVVDSLPTREPASGTESFTNSQEHIVVIINDPEEARTILGPDTQYQVISSGAERSEDVRFVTEDAEHVIIMTNNANASTKASYNATTCSLKYTLATDNHVSGTTSNTSNSMAHASPRKVTGSTVDSLVHHSSNEAVSAMENKVTCATGLSSDSSASSFVHGVNEGHQDTHSRIVDGTSGCDEIRHVSVDACYPVTDTDEDFAKFETSLRLTIDSLKDYDRYGEFLNRMIVMLQYAKYKHLQKSRL